MTFQIDAIIERKRIDPHAHAFTFGGFHSRIIVIKCNNTYLSQKIVEETVNNFF